MVQLQVLRRPSSIKPSAVRLPRAQHCLYMAMQQPWPALHALALLKYCTTCSHLSQSISAAPLIAQQHSTTVERHSCTTEKAVDLFHLGD